MLLGADRIKDIGVLEAAYNDSQSITADFILNVFNNINALTGANFDTAKMRYYSRYDREWAQIEMYAIAAAAQEIHFRSFDTFLQVGQRGSDFSGDQPQIRPEPAATTAQVL